MRVARIFNTYGPKMHMYDGKITLCSIATYIQKSSLLLYVWWVCKYGA